MIVTSLTGIVGIRLIVVVRVSLVGLVVVVVVVIVIVSVVRFLDDSAAIADVDPLLLLLLLRLDSELHDEGRFAVAEGSRSNLDELNSVILAVELQCEVPLAGLDDAIDLEIVEKKKNGE